LSTLVDDILSRIDIVDIVGKYVHLKRSWANFSANCPFHNEKTPSFMVSPTKQIFKCFGCGKWWNVITFLQDIEKIDFRDTIKELAKQANLDLSKYSFDNEKSEEYHDEKEKIKRIHRLAYNFFKDELPKSTEALNYLKDKRNLTDEMIDFFGIWFSPDSHYALIQYLKSKWFTDSDLIESSIAKKNQWWDLYSFFKGRIMFPIYDTMQNPVGFWARALNANDMPKYLNSADHKVYSKSNILYGLNRVKNEIKTFNSIIIVEWYMDVIALKRLWFPIGVATCWTALTPQHIKLLKRYTDNIYFLFDNDQAWQTASIRALNIAYQNDLFPKKILLPENSKDVDDLVNTDDWEEIFNSCFKKAKDWFLAIFDQIKKANDISSPIERQKIINTMFWLIINISNITMQEHYLHTLAEKLWLVYEVIRQQYVQFAKNEWKFLNKKTKPEAKFQLDREMLTASLFFENLIDQFIENHDLRDPIINLAKQITQFDDNIMLTKSINQKWLDQEQKNTFYEMQLWWEKELNELKDEEKRYITIKKIVLPILQSYIQKILKDKSVSEDTKHEILKLKKQSE